MEIKLTEQYVILRGRQAMGDVKCTDKGNLNEAQVRLRDSMSRYL